MANGQFKSAVREATQIVQSEGWRNVDLPTLLMFGFGHIDARTVRVDGKLAASIFLSIGGLIGGILGKVV